MSDMIRVGMADYKICCPPKRISTLGLGSCLGVVLYDPAKKICGMAHIMMPNSTMIRKNANRMKFADTCLADMLDEMVRKGARKGNLVAKVAGGAQMFVKKCSHNILNIGEQNIQAVHEFLTAANIPLVAEDVGKDYGRTIEFNPANGDLTIRSIGVGDFVI